MATRLYLPNEGTPLVAPSFDVGWGQTTDADRAPLLRAPSDTLLATKYQAEASALAVNVLLRQYVSPPLEAQSVGGAVKAIVRAGESSSAANMRAQLGARLVQADGTDYVLAKTLLALDTAGTLASEFATSLVCRKFPKAYAGAGGALTAQDAAEGDMLVVEFGYRSHNISTDSRTGGLDFGDPVAPADLPESETSSTADRPWVEFSADLVWLPSDVRIWEWPGVEVLFEVEPVTGRAVSHTVTGHPDQPVQAVVGPDTYDHAAGWSGRTIHTTKRRDRLAV